MLSCALAISLALALPHPGSLSRSEVKVVDAEVQLALRCQALTLLEELELDADGDLLLGPEEFTSSQERIEAYLLEHYRLYADGESTPLVGQVVSIDRSVEGSGEFPNSHWIRADFTYRAPAPVAALRIETELFSVSNPEHTDYTSVAWAGHARVAHIFRGGLSSWEVAPGDEEARGTFRAFVEMGFRHILLGFDHLAFLLALFIAARSSRSLAWVVTAFTLAHSVTLALAALDIVSLPTRLVEMAIALSIVYVACENLFDRKQRSLWLEAFGFGLLHGLGFASFLSEALTGEVAILGPLVGFNLGVEAGQLALVVPAALIVRSLFKGPRTSPFAKSRTSGRLVPIGLGKALSVVVAIMGLYWFGQRAGFIG